MMSISDRNALLYELKELSDEELRIKVAELHDWQPTTPGLTVAFPLYRVHKRHAAWIGTEHYPGGYIEEVPNYPRDLNACHEFEEEIPECGPDGNPDEFCDCLYMCMLMETTRVDSKWHSIIASARQRCEAYIMAKAVAESNSKGDIAT